MKSTLNLFAFCFFIFTMLLSQQALTQPNVNFTLDSAIKVYQSGDYRTAVDMFIKLKNELPARADEIQEWKNKADTCRIYLNRANLEFSQNSLYSSANSYTRVLSLNPVDDYVKERLDTLKARESQLWNRARRDPNKATQISLYEEYKNLYIGSPKVEKAEEEIDDIYWKDAGDTEIREGYRTYLASRPNGGHAEQANDYIEKYSKHWEVGIGFKVNNQLLFTESETTRTDKLLFYKVSPTNPVFISFGMHILKIEAGFSYSYTGSFKSDDRRNDGFYKYTYQYVYGGAAKFYPLNFSEKYRNQAFYSPYIFGEFQNMTDVSIRDYIGVSGQNEFTQNSYNLQLINAGLGCEFFEYYEHGFRVFVEAGKVIVKTEEEDVNELGDMTLKDILNINIGLVYNFGF